MARDVSQYMVNGVRWISVTEILELAGLVDYGHVAPGVLEVARVRGAAVHEWLELLDLGHIETGAYPGDEIVGYVEAYRAFLDESKFEAMVVEGVVRNPAYCYAGTIDRGGLLNGKLALIDLKAVAQVVPATALQTAGYGLCTDEPHERYSLQLRPDGSYRLHHYADRNDEHDFLAACRVAHWKRRNGWALPGGR